MLVMHFTSNDAWRSFSEEQTNVNADSSNPLFTEEQYGDGSSRRGKGVVNCSTLSGFAYMIAQALNRWLYRDHSDQHVAVIQREIEQYRYLH